MRPTPRRRPQIEPLELRLFLTASPTFTVTFDDPGGTYASWYTRVRGTILAAANDWSSYINSSARIDLSVDFDDSLTSPTLATAGFDDRVFFSQGPGYQIQLGNVAAELRTGVDQNGSQPDAEISIRPGALSEFYFDSTADRTGNVPNDQIDARSVLLHEIGHALGIFGTGGGPHDSPTGNRLVYDQYVQLTGTDLYFTGPNAQAAYGAPVPLSHDDSSHVGNDDGPGADIADDLMAPSIADGSRRFISSIDVGILADAGVPMKQTLIPAISVSDVTATKGAGKTATFTLTLSKASTQSISIPVTTVNGTALAGRDYTALSKTVTFAPGQTSQTVSVKLLAGSPFDKDKTFLLNLGLPTSAALLRGQATATLHNNTLAADATHPATFTEANGNRVTLTLRGPGVATINLDSAGNLNTLLLTGSSAATTLAIRSKKVATLHGLAAAGGLGALDAPNTDLQGLFSLKNVSSLSLLDLLPGTVLTLGAAAKQLTFTARNLTDTTLTDAGVIRSFTAAAWLDTDNAGDLLRAASIGAISVKGQLQADVQSNSTLASLTAGTLRSSTVRAKTSITTLTLGSSFSSDLLVGTSTFASSLADFTNKKASLKTITVKGTFADTRIAAPAITIASLGTVTTGNAGLPLGIAADTIASLTVAQPKSKRANLKSPQTLADGDFLIRVL